MPSTRIIANRVLVSQQVHVGIAVKFALGYREHPSIALWIIPRMATRQLSRPTVIGVALEALTQTTDGVDAAVLAPQFQATLNKDFFQQGTCLVGREVTQFVARLVTNVIRITLRHHLHQKIPCFCSFTFVANSFSCIEVHLLDAHINVVASLGLWIREVKFHLSITANAVRASGIPPCKTGIGGAHLIVQPLGNLLGGSGAISIYRDAHVGKQRGILTRLFGRDFGAPNHIAGIDIVHAHEIRHLLNRLATFIDGSHSSSICSIPVFLDQCNARPQTLGNSISNVRRILLFEVIQQTDGLVHVRDNLSIHLSNRRTGLTG